MLRRGFGSFGPAERRRLLDAVKGGVPDRAQLGPPVADSPGFVQALPLLLKILGMEHRG
jgi:hypothetical protein